MACGGGTCTGGGRCGCATTGTCGCGGAGSCSCSAPAGQAPAPRATRAHGVGPADDLAQLDRRERTRAWPPHNAVIPRPRPRRAARNATQPGAARLEPTPRPPTHGLAGVRCATPGAAADPAPTAGVDRRGPHPPVFLLPGITAHGPDRQVDATALTRAADLDLLLPGPHALRPGPNAFVGAIRGLGRDPAQPPVAGEGVRLDTRVTLQYRTVAVLVDADFVLQYSRDLRDWRRQIAAAAHDWDDVSTGLVSSVGDTLDALWWRIKQKKTSFQHYHDLISCWNLHQGGDVVRERYQFWPYGWGAPHKVHLWTCQMLYATTAYIDLQVPGIDDVPTYVNDCNGLGSYIASALAGGSPTNRVGDDCFLSLAYRSDGSDATKVNGWCGKQTDLELACAKPWAQEGDISQCPGRAGNDAKFGWSDWFACVTSGEGDHNCQPPPAGCATANGRHHNFSIHLHAIRMAFDGLVVDTVMHTARAMYDYGRWLDAAGRGADALAAREAAELIGRYGLAVMADRCRLYIHEIGHAWLRNSAGSRKFDFDGSHCEYNCCNDVVMTHWWCWIRGTLGLPFHPFLSSGVVIPGPDGGTDFEPDIELRYHELDPCSGDRDTVKGDTLQAYHVWSCVTREAGVAGLSPEAFCSTGCVVGLPAGGDLVHPYVLQTQDTYASWDDLCAL